MKKAITTVKTVVNAIKDGGAGIKVFTLVDPDCWEFSSFKPDAHNNLRLPDGFVRNYSLCKPADNARYVVAVKREVHGRGGQLRFTTSFRSATRSACRHRAAGSQSIFRRSAISLSLVESA